MKTKTVVASLVEAVAVLAIAQAPATYTAREAAKHVGNRNGNGRGRRRSPVRQRQHCLEHGWQTPESSFHRLCSA